MQFGMGSNLRSMLKGANELYLHMWLIGPFFLPPERESLCWFLQQPHSVSINSSLCIQACCMLARAGHRGSICSSCTLRLPPANLKHQEECKSVICLGLVLSGAATYDCKA